MDIAFHNSNPAAMPDSVAHNREERVNRTPKTAAELAIIGTRVGCQSGCFSSRWGIRFAAIQSRLIHIALTIAATILQIFPQREALAREFRSVPCAPKPTLKAFRYNLIGSIFNQTLTSSIGGEAVGLWRVDRTGAGWGGLFDPDRSRRRRDCPGGYHRSEPIWSCGMIGDANGRLALVDITLVDHKHASLLHYSTRDPYHRYPLTLPTRQGNSEVHSTTNDPKACSSSSAAVAAVGMWATRSVVQASRLREASYPRPLRRMRR